MRTNFVLRQLKDEGRMFRQNAMYVDGPYVQDDFVVEAVQHETIIFWCQLAEKVFLVEKEMGSSLAPLFDDDASYLMTRISTDEHESNALRAMAMVARATMQCTKGCDAAEATYRRRAKFLLAVLAHLTFLGWTDLSVAFFVQSFLHSILHLTMSIQALSSARPAVIDFLKSCFRQTIVLWNLRARQARQTYPET